MIVLTNNSHVKELEKIAELDSKLELNDLKDFVFSVQDKQFEVVKTEPRHSKESGHTIHFLITSNYLDYIKVVAIISKDGLSYEIRDTYKKEYLEEGFLKHGNFKELGNLLTSYKEELVSINEDNAKQREKDIIFNEIINKGYKFKQEYEVQEDGTSLYIVTYVDIPKIEARSMNLPEAVNVANKMFNDWAKEIANSGEKVKLPKVTAYVEDNLDAPRNA